MAFKKVKLGLGMQPSGKASACHMQGSVLILSIAKTDKQTDRQTDRQQRNMLKLEMQTSVPRNKNSTVLTKGVNLLIAEEPAFVGMFQNRERAT